MARVQNQAGEGYKNPPQQTQQQPSSDLHSCSAPEDLLATALYILTFPKGGETSGAVPLQRLATGKRACFPLPPDTAAA